MNVGRCRWRWEAMMRAEEEYEAKKVRFHGPVRAPLNQALGLAATGLQEERKDHTENASKDKKENIEVVKKLDEAQIQ